MPDLSRNDVSQHAHAHRAKASVKEVWDSISPEQKAQVLGQETSEDEGNNYSNNNSDSVYQKDTDVDSQDADYDSLPEEVKDKIAENLDKQGYFADTFGAFAYEVEDEDRLECKDCEQIFTSEEDLRVHRRIDHDNDESITDSIEAYNKITLDNDPAFTKENLKKAKTFLKSTEGSRQIFPQNEPPTLQDPALPKGEKGYNDNPNHYFYDNKIFKRGSRGGNYEQEGTALTEALVAMEEEILEDRGWEDTKEADKDNDNREIYEAEVTLRLPIAVENIKPRTMRVLDEADKNLLFRTLRKLGARWSGETQSDDYDIQVLPEQPRHQDYNPEDPHEHNDFDTYFGDQTPDETTLDPPSDVDVNPVQEAPDKDAKKDAQQGEEADEFPQDTTNTCPECGYYTQDTDDMIKHKADHEPEAEEGGSGSGPQEGGTPALLPEQSAMKNINPEYDPFKATPKSQLLQTDPYVTRTTEEAPEETTKTEPELLQNVDFAPEEIESEDYNIDEIIDKGAKEAKTYAEYTGRKQRAGETAGDILEGAINTPVAVETVEEKIYNRKLEGHGEDTIARELLIYNNIEYDDAIEKIRSIEVSGDDRVAKTLFGKKLAECNQGEITEIKILSGEAKKPKRGKEAKIPSGDLYQSGSKVGTIRDYNPKQHEGYVTLDGIGIEEFGAMTSDYEVKVNGERIPNKWDGKHDYNLDLFGESKSSSELKREIKKLEKIISVGSEENPLNMGDWNDRLDSLKSELESLGGEELEATEAECPSCGEEFDDEEKLESHQYTNYHGKYEDDYDQADGGMPRNEIGGQ